MSFPSASPEGPNSSSASGHSPTGTRAGLPATAPHPAPEIPSARSCITCRRRKVRCNKRSPCSNCVRAGIDCVFPPPGRAPRKSKRPPDSELLSRLRRLEGVIEHLSGAKAKNSESGGSRSSLSPTRVAADQAFQSVSTAVPTTLASASAPGLAPAPIASIAAAGSAAPNSACPFENDPKAPVTQNFENEFGRLVIDEGKSRYVSNRLWASLGDEVRTNGITARTSNTVTMQNAHATSFFFFSFHHRLKSSRISSIIHHLKKKISHLPIPHTQVPMTGFYSGSILYHIRFANFILSCPEYRFSGRHIERTWLPWSRWCTEEQPGASWLKRRRTQAHWTKITRLSSSRYTSPLSSA